MDKKVLKKGYTTGVHTLHAFKSALEAYLSTQETAVSKTIKIDNDDLDVTKGCEIIVTISSTKQNLTLNKQKQHAQIFKHKSNNVLELFAGLGVGVVTKKGLKIPPFFPAINPKPLEALEHCFQLQVQHLKNQHLFATVEVTHGEEIAKQTANAKVGVLGGISILGTTGIVKPVSSSAYIDSVRTEIQFAHSNNYKNIYFTLGNSAYKAALEQVNEESVIEIGNFVYDSIQIATELKIKQIVFLCGIGKMTKVYQGFKNTHNRFGTIDFIQLKQDIKEELHYEVDIESTLTVKGISQELETVGKLQAFYKMITQKANEQIKQWFPHSNVDAIILEQKDILGW
jgi:cobalt-precorrin-5B (C1)-methyltransferase